MKIYCNTLIAIICHAVAVNSFCCIVKDSWESWNKNKLTYRIVSYPHQYSKQYTDFVFLSAFKLWEQNGGITFSQVTDGKSDIVIKFDRRNEHGIFRTGNEISFSFAPGPHEYSGDITFNNDVLWTTDGGAFDFLKRIVYEIGIAIGLKKNDRETSIMNPNKKCYARQLDELDREVRKYCLDFSREKN